MGSLPIIESSLGFRDLVLHDLKEQDWHDLGHGGAGGGVTRLAGGGHLYGVDPGTKCH